MKHRTDPQTDLERWYHEAYVQLVASPEVRRAARIELDCLAAGTDLNPQDSDIEAARNYLRKCVMSMTVFELETLSAQEAGMLLARGALGQARYRRDQMRKKKRPLRKRFNHSASEAEEKGRKQR